MSFRFKSIVVASISVGCENNTCDLRNKNIHFISLTIMKSITASCWQMPKSTQTSGNKENDTPYGSNCGGVIIQ